MAEKQLVEVSEEEVCIDFIPNTKCRTTVTLRSLSPTTTVAFKIQTSSPQKFLVNPPNGLIPPSSSSSFQIILRPQPHLPPSFPRSPSDRFLIKTAPFGSSVQPSSLSSWFASLPEHHPTRDLKLKVAFVGPFLLRHAVSSSDLHAARNILKRQSSLLSSFSPVEAESLLRVAARLPRPEPVVDLLLESGLKVDAAGTRKGWGELHVAAALGRTEDVMGLAKELGTVDLRDKEGRTALHLAVSRGNIGCGKALVELGADVDAKSRDGRTALYRAVANGDRQMVEMLIEFGADPTVADDRGRSPFDVARDKGHEGVVEILECGELALAAARRGELEHLKSLLRRGASVSYRDQHGFTALHAAAMKGHRDVVLVLYEFGVDLECRDVEGHTPLHLAVEGGKLDTVEALVDRGANVNARSENGVTPLFMARVFGYDAILQFLTAKGASFSPPPTSFDSAL